MLGHYSRLYCSFMPQRHKVETKAQEGIKKEKKTGLSTIVDKMVTKRRHSVVAPSEICHQLYATYIEPKTWKSNDVKSHGNIMLNI